MQSSEIILFMFFTSVFFIKAVLHLNSARTFRTDLNNYALSILIWILYHDFKGLRLCKEGSSMEGTLHTDLWKSETSREIKKSH